MWGVLKSLFTGSSGGGLAGQALALAAEKIVDADKFYALVVEVIKSEHAVEVARLQAVTYRWVDALHKMARPLMGAGVFAWVAYCQAHGIPVQMDELLTASGMGGVYMMMKGRGR